MPARKSGSRGAWDRFEADMKTLGRDFRRQYDEGGPGKAGDVQESMRKLAAAAEEVFDNLGRASRDPDVRKDTRKAAQSFGEAIAQTFRELADQLEGAIKSKRD